MDPPVSSDPEPAKLGARPRPMDVQQWLYLVSEGECVLRLVSKPVGGGASLALGKMASGSGGLRRCLAAAADSGTRRFQGFGCIFFVE